MASPTTTLAYLFLLWKNNDRSITKWCFEAELYVQEEQDLAEASWHHYLVSYLIFLNVYNAHAPWICSGCLMQLHVTLYKEASLWVRYYCKCFISFNSANPHNNTMGQALL